MSSSSDDDDDVPEGCGDAHKPFADALAKSKPLREVSWKHIVCGSKRLQFTIQIFMVSVLSLCLIVFS